jgi:pimeloyl-ACP methyl ester carboxylesterase
VRYDERGNGLSDWEVDDISFDAFVRDLEAVVDAVGLERFALLGISQGCPVSIAYAVRHPERVSQLVLYGGYALGWAKRGPKEKEQGNAMTALVRQGWGQDNPAFRQMFTSRMIPGATAEQMQWFNELQRITTSPDNAARLRLAMGDIDVMSLLPQVSAPTLVIHAREDALAPFDGGRKIAAMIPGARFVPLESANHLLLENEPAWPRFLAEVRSFLG